jgi:hypothetical protein
MDAFWLIPFVIILIAFVWIFYAIIKRRPSAPAEPRVLVDKPAEKPPVDESIKAQDWSTRPSGSYMNWLGTHKKSQE